MKKNFKRSAVLFFGTLSIYLILLIYPSFLFAFNYEFKNFHIYSDRPIPSTIDEVLEKVKTNLSQSELYEKEDKFHIYFCNDEWRFTFFTRNKNAGGVVNFPISPNVFIRASDIENDEIIPPSGWLLSRHDRPLSYFLAHEATHSLERKIDPLLQLKTPSYILEGYSDYIGKGTTFDFEMYRKMYLENDKFMDPKNGLYNRYHLYIAYLMEKKGKSFKDILKSQPDLETTLAELRK